ncbi:exo-poly-alpha-D-galacturonosidase [Klebsiella michiganensis]|uniref:Exo-poly-alpha-D-galacturonosidase n=1 Tax=Klebsiella michiganensis TaxID=1134687 RepID=A0A7H4LY82_9ENTR|nr:exo-poly-alpha-D-galacturonosidase [Klebsiella michiganensis]
MLISDGEFKTGALFLHSDMTLEIAAGATLLGSDDPAQYPLEKGYYLYPYSDHPQPRRPPSLINVLEADDKGESPAGTFRNIRIVGQGTIDGNGWTRGVKSGGEATIIDEMGNAAAAIPGQQCGKSQRGRHSGKASDRSCYCGRHRKQ